ncbi:MAG: SxtJ family membrane protein [Desulfobulbaceae bacterium]
MTHFNRNPSRKELRDFGLITGGMAAGVFGLALPLLFAHDFPRWPWIVGSVLIAWALAAPATLMPVYRVWMTIGMVLGWINTRIIMTVMFYLIIVPVGLLRRMAGKDPMARTMSPEERTYRKASDVPDRKHVERPF